MVAKDTLYAVTLVIVNMINVFIIGHHFWNRRTDERQYSYRGRDFPQALPLPALDPVALSMDYKSGAYPIAGNDSNLQWLLLMSTNGGWTRLGPTNRLVLPSLYHEMHCLRLINLALFRVTASNMEHSRHCLNYFREMALCHADVALEPMANATEGVFAWDNTRATHTCRNWPVVYDHMDRNWDEWKPHVGHGQYVGQRSTQ